MHNRSQCYGLEAASWLSFCCKPAMQLRQAHGTPMNRTDPKILCPIHFIPAVFHRYFFIINHHNTMHIPAIFLQTHFLKGAPMKERRDIVSLFFKVPVLLLLLAMSNASFARATDISQAELDRKSTRLNS